MMEELPKRKHPRLKTFDYSLNGAYFITVCTENRKCALSRVVGRGLAPAEMGYDCNSSDFIKTGGEIVYTKCGKIAEDQLLLLEERYPFLKIDRYVIMPNHIHIILVIEKETAGASPRPTVMDIICAYKSLTTRECKKIGFTGKLFQTSFYDHIIRNRDDYNETLKYIDNNPINWYYDELYTT